MDAVVQLALIEKAKKVFAPDVDVFLSFPLLSPLTYSVNELGALSTPDSVDEFARAADFARTVNFLPRDMVVDVGGESYLWDVYSQVLARAEVAEGTGDATQPAPTLLFDTAADGTRVESDVYRRYRQYRDAWIVARQAYGAGKLSAELSSDPTIGEQWRNVDEPVLGDALSAAELAWQELGHRGVVEAALREEREAAASDPRRRWAEWSDAFNTDIDLLTEASGARYAPTALSPSDFATQATWLRFDLSSSEIAALVADAPPELKIVLDGEGADVNVERVSFEYRSVAIVRPWFRSEALTSRIWRSEDDDLQLSTGTEPPDGSCPGYATAIVFVRALDIVPKTSSEPAPSSSPFRFTLATEAFVRPRPTKSPFLRALRPQPQPTVPTPDREQVARTVFRKLQNASFKVVAPQRVTSIAVESAAVRRFAAGPMVRSMISPVIRRALLPAGDGGRPPMPPIPAPPSPPRPTPTRVDDEIAVLAFICKRLPRTPDPLPELRWS